MLLLQAGASRDSQPSAPAGTNADDEDACSTSGRQSPAIFGEIRSLKSEAGIRPADTALRSGCARRCASRGSHSSWPCYAARRQLLHHRCYLLSGRTLPLVHARRARPPRHRASRRASGHLWQPLSSRLGASCFIARPRRRALPPPHTSETNRCILRPSACPRAPHPQAYGKCALVPRIASCG